MECTHAHAASTRGHGVRYSAATRVPGLWRADAGVAKATEGGEGGRARTRLGWLESRLPNPIPPAPFLNTAARLEPEISRRHPTRQFVLLILSTASRKRKLIPGPATSSFSSRYAWPCNKIHGRAGARPRPRSASYGAHTAERTEENVLSR